jgi:hypothetical protein
MQMGECAANDYTSPLMLGGIRTWPERVGRIEREAERGGRG